MNEFRTFIRYYRQMKFFTSNFERYMSNFSNKKDGKEISNLVRSYELIKIIIDTIDLSIKLIPQTKSNTNNEMINAFTYMYVQRLPRSEIAKKMHISERNVYLLCSNAVTLISKNFNMLIASKLEFIDVDDDSKTYTKSNLLMMFNEESAIKGFYQLVVYSVKMQLGVVEHSFAKAMLIMDSYNKVIKYITNDCYKYMTRSAAKTYYRSVSEYIGVCVLGIDYLTAQQGFTVKEKNTLVSLPFDEHND